MKSILGIMPYRVHIFHFLHFSGRKSLWLIIQVPEVIVQVPRVIVQVPDPKERPTEIKGIVWLYGVYRARGLWDQNGEKLGRKSLFNLKVPLYYLARQSIVFSKSYLQKVKKKRPYIWANFRTSKNKASLLLQFSLHICKLQQWYSYEVREDILPFPEISTNKFLVYLIKYKVTTFSENW